MKKFSIVSSFLAGAGLTFLAGIAISQVITVPQVVSVGPGDLFQDVVNGSPAVGNKYATAAQINGPIGYLNEGVLATGQTIAFGNATTEVYAQSSGTIAAVTLTASANPGDGQLNCYLNIATTSGITWNANTNQSISGAPTAGVANTKACMIWNAANATWYRA